jgi:hypothetical protein
MIDFSYACRSRASRFECFLIKSGYDTYRVPTTRCASRACLAGPQDWATRYCFDMWSAEGYIIDQKRSQGNLLYEYRSPIHHHHIPPPFHTPSVCASPQAIAYPMRCAASAPTIFPAQGLPVYVRHIVYAHVYPVPWAREFTTCDVLRRR